MAGGADAARLSRPAEQHRGPRGAPSSSASSGRYKVAAFFHEIVMMNYGGAALARNSCSAPTRCAASTTCRRSSTRSSRACGRRSCSCSASTALRPSCGRGQGLPRRRVPGLAHPVQRGMDCLPQFGALVTNGQEEIASLAYLVTMRWAQENARPSPASGTSTRAACVTGRAPPDAVAASSGRRHLAVSLPDLGGAALRGRAERSRNRHQRPDLQVLLPAGGPDQAAPDRLLHSGGFRAPTHGRGPGSEHRLAARTYC